MWKLNSISAQNLCAFKELKYQIEQNRTTLVFGNNMDNDSQGSNGSGKSALLEVIAIGLTGGTLRNIKMEEIINDAENEAIVEIALLNSITSEVLTINRKISRKSPQEITLTHTLKDGTPQPIVQSSVADYNKCVLDMVGLTKEDVLSNYILSKHKYVSFLSSSDRAKKDIINRFSHGNLVDESIAALQRDMEPVQQEVRDAETNVAVLTGKVDTLSEQIDAAINESISRSQKKSERIAEWKRAIADKRAYIREISKEINDGEDVLDKYDDLDEQLQKIEKSKKGVEECYQFIHEQFAALELPAVQDYVTIASSKKRKMEELEEEYAELQKQIKTHDKQLSSACTSHDKLVAKYNQFSDTYSDQYSDIEKQINSLLVAIQNLEKENKTLRRERNNIESEIASIQKQLAGVIVCPKCKHEFTLANNLDIADARKQLKGYEQEVESVLKSIDDNAKKIESYTADGKIVRQKQNNLIEQKAKWSKEVTEDQAAVDKLTRQASRLSQDAKDIQDNLFRLQKSIHETRVNLFDEAYDVLDDAINKKNNALNQLDLNIKNAEGAILSYEESIQDIEKSVEADMEKNLRESKAKYEAELAEAFKTKESVEQKLSTLKTQESTFIEFKTHLANSKIDALSQITNEFLEAIGSDIRIVFSGFTVLKSGKVREKISISLLRDGIDCGSFDKFSAGERARVELANILAMHKLTNINCDDEKGLDLLVLDEILEAVDEQGLSNIFEALNHLQITSLVVSHGNIAEGYPYKVVVNKLNGVSYL